ncbi:MAG: hypothetical protein K2G87_06380 [Oscillospiraceae bacterium]|nr:hypothetical protein [Oscillospiraceae bacterium]
MKHYEKIKAVPDCLQSMKKRIKQSLALVGILIMSLSLSGCEKLVETDVSAETRSQTSYNGTQNATDTANQSEFHYITDWSIDEVVQNIEMNGTSYSMPFTVGDLGENYSLEAIDRTPGGYFLNYCGDEHYALIDVYNDDTDIKKCRIRSITVNDNVDFKIDNLSFGVKREKILEKYGEPSLATNETVWTYVFEGETEDQNSVLLFTFNKKGKLDGISIGYNKYKEKIENE